MVLYVIGLGMGDEKDVTVKGLEAIRGCSRLYLEAYTSVLGVDQAKLEKFYGKPITIADRNFVELDADRIYSPALTEDIGFLVVGDPFCATTHSDLQLRAEAMGVEVRVVHNVGVMGAVGCSGLSLYTFGQCISLCFFTEGWRPDSWYEKLQYNRQGGMHTLCLLDIKVKEPDFAKMAKGVEVFLPPRFMTCAEAAAQLLEVEEKKRGEGGGGAYTADTICVGMARLGQADQQVVCCSLGEMAAEKDLGPPLHCLAVVGELHEIETAALRRYGYEGPEADVGIGGFDGSGSGVAASSASADTGAEAGSGAGSGAGAGAVGDEGSAGESAAATAAQTVAGGAAAAEAAPVAAPPAPAAAAPAPAAPEFSTADVDKMADAASFMDQFGETSSDEDEGSSHRAADR